MVERWVLLLVLLKVDIFLFVTETSTSLDELEDDESNDANTDQRCNSGYRSDSTLVVAEAVFLSEPTYQDFVIVGWTYLVPVAASLIGDSLGAAEPLLDGAVPWVYVYWL